MYSVRFTVIIVRKSADHKSVVFETQMKIANFNVKLCENMKNIANSTTQSALKFHARKRFSPSFVVEHYACWTHFVLGFPNRQYSQKFLRLFIDGVIVVSCNHVFDTLRRFKAKAKRYTPDWKAYTCNYIWKRSERNRHRQPWLAVALFVRRIEFRFVYLFTRNVGMFEPQRGKIRDYPLLMRRESNLQHRNFETLKCFKRHASSVGKIIRSRGRWRGYLFVSSLFFFFVQLTT